jgi:RNA polymerase sigma factor (sigma-70 family)
LTGEASTQATDAAIVGRCRRGDQRAWAELVERFSGYVYAIVARGFELSRHDAEDVFQEVFARLYEHLDELRDDEAVRPWIAQTARRLAVDCFRRAGPERPNEPAELPDEGELDARIERLDEALDLREALASLAEPCQEVLVRFFIHDQSYDAISAAMDTPPGTIASRISRRLAKLRETLEGRPRGAPPSRKSRT